MKIIAQAPHLSTVQLLQLVVTNVFLRHIYSKQIKYNHSTFPQNTKSIKRLVIMHSGFKAEKKTSFVLLKRSCIVHDFKQNYIYI